MRKSNFILLMAASLCIVTAKAQHNFPVTYLGIEQGLSNNSVSCIYQDHHGFMWFGTYDGLCRYDSYGFKIFRNKINEENSLINNRVSAICEDEDDRIWIGTKKGLCYYDNKNLRYSRVSYTLWKQPGVVQKITIPVNDLKADKEGNVLIGTAGNGLLLYRKGAAYAEQIPVRAGSNSLTDYHVQGAWFDENGKLWVFVQNKGICVYNSQSHELNLINGTVTSGTALVGDKAGHLWIATPAGLARYHMDSNAFSYYKKGATQLSSENIMSITMDKSQRLWLATDGEGINILDTRTGQIEYLFPGQHKKAITSASVTTVFEDKDARIWIGTLRGGINIVDPKTNRFTTISHDPLNGNSLTDNFVLSLGEGLKDEIWIGTDGGGLSRWNRKQQLFTNYKKAGNPLGCDFITAICRDDQNAIWFGTYGGGISRYSNNGFKRYYCRNEKRNANDNYIWTLYKDSKGTLWAGALEGGLYRYDRLKDRFELFDEKLRYLLTLTEDREGVLWGGSYDELFRIDQVNKKHVSWPMTNPVRAIHAGKGGVLWIGTEGSGLLRYNVQQNQFKAFTEADGLSNNSVLTILEDKQENLWLGTFYGISKFSSGGKGFQNFYQSDGLQSNQLNYNAALTTSEGELLFGGIKGFNIFYPDSIRFGSDMPILRLTDLKIDNRSIEQDNSFTENTTLADLTEVALPYDKAVISIEYAALEYLTADKISYAYLLEGWDKSWNYVGKLRTANYSHLTEGEYTLRIKSTNGEGLWNTQERIVRITVFPPWYRSWWAYLLYIAVIAGLIAVYIRYKNKQAQLAYEVKLAHVNAERESELNRRKFDFFTNIAHEFRTPLTLIINPIKDFLYKPDAGTGPAEMKMVYRNSKRLLSLVDQLLLFKKADSGVDELHAVNLQLNHICREVFLCFTQQAKSQQINYQFECSAPQIEVYADREKLEIAIFNLISNAMKFTPAGGTIRVRLEEKEKNIELSVEDTGCGIPGEIGERLFERFYQSKHNGASLKAGFGIGLFLAKTFVEAHKGQLDYTTKLEQGTTFRISLLKGKDHFETAQIFPEGAGKSDILEELSIQDVSPLPEVRETERLPQRDVSMDTLITGGHTLLLVDDNEEITDYLRQVFKDSFTLFVARNGKEGLAMAMQHMPDIIISDIVMDEMTGIEFCKAIKEDPALSHIQLILLTGSSSAEIKLKGVECGADDYITKPFERDLLLARVSNLLKSRNNLQKYFYNEITLRKNELSISEDYKVFLERCIETVEAHIDRDDFSIKFFAKEMGMSHSNLYKRVRQVSGQSINSFIRFIRLRRAAGLLISTDCNVNEAAFQVGIADSKYFRLQFAKLFGMNPSDYKKKYHQAFQKNYTVHVKAVKTRASP
jgi:signal transduction histidine kinase/ligand-binding sensor domain-containing protein/DNA-binding response OmpR family regulator